MIYHLLLDERLDDLLQVLEQSLAAHVPMVSVHEFALEYTVTFQRAHLQPLCSQVLFISCSMRKFAQAATEPHESDEIRPKLRC